MPLRGGNLATETTAIEEMLGLLKTAAPILEKGNGIHLHFHDIVFIGMVRDEDAVRIVDLLKQHSKS